MPYVVAQLDRLSALAKENKDRQQEIDRFVKEINATGRLLDKHISTLSENVSRLLQNGLARTDAQFIRDLETLTRQLEDIQERIDAGAKDPETKSRTSAALAGTLGDDIARFDFASASRELEAIARIDKKIDIVIGAVACNAETGEAARSAIEARAAERVIDNLRCHPENRAAIKPKLVAMFSAREFPAKDFLNKLIQ
jgi:hypothetical protein